VLRSVAQRRKQRCAAALRQVAVLEKQLAAARATSAGAAGEAQRAPPPAFEWLEETEVIAAALAQHAVPQSRAARPLSASPVRLPPPASGGGGVRTAVEPAPGRTSVAVHTAAAALHTKLLLEVVMADAGALTADAAPGEVLCACVPHQGVPEEDPRVAPSACGDAARLAPAAAAAASVSPVPAPPLSPGEPPLD